MIRKARQFYFTALMVIAVLLIPSGLPVFGESGKQESESQQPGPANQAESRFQDALSSLDAGDRQTAFTQLQEAMRLWVARGEPEKAAKAALQMGDHSKQANIYQDALTYYGLAIRIKRLSGAVMATVSNATATVYAALYLYPMAERYFKRALEQARASDDFAAQAIAEAGLGRLYLQQGALGKAQSCIAQALQASQKDQVAANPDLLCLKGQVNREQGMVDEARYAFEEALAIYEKEGNVAGRVRTLCELSTLSLLVSQGRVACEQASQAVDLAEQQASRAVSLADYENARDLQWRAWLSCARAERALGENAQALSSYSLATGHTQGRFWETYIATEASAVAFRESTQSAFRENVDLLMEQGEIKKAYELADRTKSRVLLNFTGARRAKPVAEESKDSETLSKLSRAAAPLRIELLAPDLTRERQAKLQSDLEEIESQRQELQMKTEAEQYLSRLVWTKYATFDQMQKQTAEQHRALVEFFLGEDRSFVWLFADGEFYAETLPGRKVIEQAVEPYIEALAAPINHLHLARDIDNLRAQGATLCAKLFGSLLDHIDPEQRLIVVPDGLLYYLPFETLVRNERYLIEDHEISYSPSAGMVELLESTPSRASSDPQMDILAVGNPIFESQEAAGRENSSFRSHRRMRRMLKERGFHLTPLPRTQDEIQYIVGLFPADRRKALMGLEGTETALKRESLRRYRYLHFATHSLIDEKMPSRSAIVLSPSSGAEDDGFLEVGEIASLDLDCDLVVVSACQTGRGQLLSGEGIIGMSRAFIYAGARAVVVSLWNVSDQSASQLMKFFYRNLTDGLGNATALRQAKLQMINSGKATRHPGYWSAFIMTGKP